MLFLYFLCLVDCSALLLLIRATTHPQSSTSLFNTRHSHDKEEKAWQTGKIFTKNNAGNRRHERKDAWWMREEEANNPRILPKYQPRWLESCHVDKTWKLADLKTEAMKRGLKTSGKKDELVARINAHAPSMNVNMLSDKYFKGPSYFDFHQENKPSCYPDMYETPEEIVRLRELSNGPLE